MTSKIEGKLELPNKKYKIIYADPPWQYDDKSLSHGGGAECHFDTMSVEDICHLPIEQLADEDSILFIWGTWTHINEVQRVIRYWGFDYKTVGFVWIKKYSNGKNYFGMGRWTRANTEYCLIATRGKPKRLNDSISQIIESIPKAHSKKPDLIRKKIVQLVGDLPRIELFARTKIHGWDTWGNDEKLTHEPLESFA